MNDQIVDAEAEQRHRKSQRSRSRPVTLGQCPKCGTPLPAATAAEIKTGAQKCPR